VIGVSEAGGTIRAVDLRAELPPPQVSEQRLDEPCREISRIAEPRIVDITTDELVEIVRRVLAGDPESDYYLRLLEANVSHPRVSDVIFYPPAELRDASAEQIVDEILGYRPIAL
jgi:hypothetical protein